MLCKSVTFTAELATLLPAFAPSANLSRYVLPAKLLTADATLSNVIGLVAFTFV